MIQADWQIDRQPSVYAQIGEEKIAELVAAFYRQIPTDDILGPMYPQADLAGAEHRLKEFLIYRLGGPPRYLEERGHPRLRMRHIPFHIDQAARDRWVQLMDRALESCQLPEPVTLALRQFFHDMASFLRNDQ